MIFRKKRLVATGMILIACIFYSAPNWAQNPSIPQQRTPGALLQVKIQKQRTHIENGIKNGTITRTQAEEALSKLAAIVSDLQARKAANGGTLKLNDVQEFGNRLNANRDYLVSLLGSNKNVDDGPNVLGPNWQPGPDGAQNAHALKQEMKQEERRELRQEEQAMQQVREQQQLDYEQQMMEALGQQHRKIIQNKNELQTIRDGQQN